MLNALSVDLEEYFQVSNFAESYERSRWDELPSRVESQTERLLDLFEETGSRATFFVLGWVAERHPRLVRAVADRGHEIACHGYGHELVYEIGPERFAEDLSRARRAIEAAAGVSVQGYRAPSFSITERSLWALEILAEQGFHFDSSVFPIRHHRYGIPSFEPRPVELALAGGRSIREFPMTTLSLGPVKLPLAGGAYLRFLPAALSRWGLGRLDAADEPTVLYLHPWEIDPEQPRPPVSWKVRINHYHNLGRVEQRVRKLLQRFRYGALGDVLDELAAAGRLPRRELQPALQAA